MVKKQILSDNEQGFIKTFGYFIIYFMIGIIPHIYRYMTFKPGESEHIFFKESLYADLYILSKSQVFLLLTIILIGIFLYQLRNKDIELKRDIILLITGVFGLIIVLSSIFSEYKDIVFWGAKDRFEGMFIWLAYLVLFIIVRHYANDIFFVKTAQKVFVLSASIMALFGLMQVFGYDIYTSGPLRWLVFPKEVAENMSTFMMTNVTEAGAVGALYNSNYFGVYSAVALTLSLFFAFTEEKNVILYFGISILQYGALIASKSEAALLGFAIVLPFFIIIFGKKIINRRQYAFTALVLAIIIDRFLAMNLLYGQSGNALWIYMLMTAGIIVGWGIFRLLDKNEYIKSYIATKSKRVAIILVLLIVVGINMGVMLTGNAGKVGNLKTLNLDQNLIISEHVNNASIIIECLENGVNVYDESGISLEPNILGENHLSYNTGSILYDFKVKTFSNGYLMTFNQPYNINIFFDGAELQYVNPVTGVGRIDTPRRIEFYYNNGTAFTNRGYIWSTYLPIAKQNMFLGKGLDTYLVGFPQNDYFGKYRFYDEGDHLLVDKPHSLYVGIFFSVGLFGLIIMILFSIYVVTKYLQGITDEVDSDGYIIALLGAALILIAGIFNDSTIPLTMLLSCFGGMGLMIDGETSR